MALSLWDNQIDEEVLDVDDEDMFVCENCGYTCSLADIEYDDINFYDICPKCHNKQKW
jgi:rubrerythrin